VCQSYISQVLFINTEKELLRTVIGQITNGLFSGRLPPTSRKTKNHEQHNPLNSVARW
jgi:hypothetical protein